MFRAKTVLVLGAGASVDLGLPMGDALLNNIRDLLRFQFEYGNRQKSGDSVIVESLMQHLDGRNNHETLNSHLRAGHRIVQASLQAPSIDNLVDALENDAVTLVAKMAIVRAIHKAEADSLCAKKLRDNNRALDLNVFREHWYNSLSKLLFTDVRLSDVNSIFENLQIISFNYDRCLEAYLPQSISNYYGLPLDEAERIVLKLPIHRPYGIAGDLRTVRFGGCEAEQLADVAQGVRTFTEQITDETALDGIRSSLEDADRIVFLGFAFHRQNLKLLECEARENVEVLATAYGISKSDCDVITREVCQTFEGERRLLQSSVELAPVKCDQFFNEYWRTLTAERYN